MSPKGLLVLQTTASGYRFGFNFRPDSDLYYLTGLADEDLTLILSKPGFPNTSAGGNAHSILLTAPPVGLSIDRDEYFVRLADSLGFDYCASVIELRKILKQISDIDVFYNNLIRQDQQQGNSIIEKRLIQFIQQFPQVSFTPIIQLTGSMRRIKTSDEIALIQKAVDITIQAHQEAFKSMRPGLYEYQIEAIIEFIFKFNGAEQLAFPTIIGAGPNSLILHYEQGMRQIQRNDIVVMDIGCEYQHYCADITRTIPATGKFTLEQKEIYNIVLEANQTIIAMLKPGVTIAQMDSAARAIIGKYGYEKYIRHGCTHYLGLDVHDVGNTREPLLPGCVVTVEPGIYISPNSDLPEAYWNIGVRIEDDVLIT
ncbi:MAG: M24 family metallopeptidase, partial [bacterium]|nr:M24 family metallopeptidase [bacterium]